MQTLPRQDEHRPRLYLGKDEVECGITAAMTRGGPAVRTREMGKYFQAVLYFFFRLTSLAKMKEIKVL